VIKQLEYALLVLQVSGDQLVLLVLQIAQVIVIQLLEIALLALLGSGDLNVQYLALDVQHVIKQVESVLVALLGSINHLIVSLVLQIVRLEVFAMPLLVIVLHVLMASLGRNVKLIVM